MTNSEKLASQTALYNEENTTPNPGRIERLAEAIELGADDQALEAIRLAVRTSKSDTIVLPPHRYEGLSRGRGWCRMGAGGRAVWGERVTGGYEVSEGKWTVGGNDGFSRKGEDRWVVKRVQVGRQVWTVANCS